MNFDLVRPCDNCPFRTDCLEGWLGEERAEQIVNSLLYSDQSFSCHKTTYFDDEGEHIPQSKEQHCAGAMILLEKLDRPNQMMRICERIGLYDRRKLEMDSPVFDDDGDFISHHAN